MRFTALLFCVLVLCFGMDRQEQEQEQEDGEREKKGRSAGYKD